MRAAFVVSTILSSCACVVFFACGEDPATSPVSDAGDTENDGSQGSSSGSLGNPTDGGTVADTGARLKNGCLLFSTPMASGKTVQNLPKSGSPNWTNVEGALKEDDQVASVILNDSQESAELRISDFGLDVPPTAATWGIIVELKRKQLVADGGIQTANVNVDIVGKETQFKFDNAKFFWPSTIVGTHGYGQEIDTWGIDLQPAHVNAAQFAARLVAKKGSSPVPGPITGTVDALRVQVWYATGDEKTCKR